MTIIEKRAPTDDFRRLADYLNDEGHNDYLKTNRLEVEWADTESYRVFRFNGLVVFVYPYDWTPERRDISILVDQGQDSNDFRDHFLPVEYNEAGNFAYVVRNIPELGSEPPSIGFGPFVFYRSKASILEDYLEKVERASLSLQDRRRRSSIAKIPSNCISYELPHSHGSIDGVCVFRDASPGATPIWLRLHNRGMPQLSFIAWNSAGGTPVNTIAQGKFEWNP